jgi:hypothetical protein
VTYKKKSPWSQTGKEIIIKAVAQAVLTYTITTKKNAFFWGTKPSKQVIETFEKSCFDRQDGPQKPLKEFFIAK